jgi:hypothetical protein
MLVVLTLIIQKDRIHILTVYRRIIFILSIFLQYLNKNLIKSALKI